MTTENETDEKPRPRALDYETTRAKVGLGKTRFSQILNDPKAGFPRPVELFKRKYIFLEDEVDAWLRKLPRKPMPRALKSDLPALFASKARDRSEAA